MDAWETRIGMDTMSHIQEMARDIKKIANETPTLRDKFAMDFMNGYSSNLGSRLSDETLGDIAKLSYKFADAMLKAREDSN